MLNEQGNSAFLLILFSPYIGRVRAPGHHWDAYIDLLTTGMPIDYRVKLGTTGMPI